MCVSRQSRRGDSRVGVKSLVCATPPAAFVAGLLSLVGWRNPTFIRRFSRCFENRLPWFAAANWFLAVHGRALVGYFPGDRATLLLWYFYGRQPIRPSLVGIIPTPYGRVGLSMLSARCSTSLMRSVSSSPVSSRVIRLAQQIGASSSHRAYRYTGGAASITIMVQGYHGGSRSDH